ncbi:hypothetical protein GDO86_011994 [Hymenochirus boettgeri]|uniref:Uncharacterized protein n=1 Tax=Hymenochirus boettgeri TaxID=247094 RepID=A0A8T2JIC2_9PIPI|nr:hypothetical protein GDO86_011994 [Hymenochirus boettgeri]
MGNGNAQSGTQKGRAGYLSLFSLEDDRVNIPKEDKGIKHFNGRTRRNTKKKNERPKKPCLGCFSSMARPQRQKREMTEDERRESRRHKKQHKKEWKERSKHHRHGRHRKFKIEESTGKSKGKPHTRTLSVISSINEGPRREGEGMKHHRSHKKGKHTRIHHHELPKLKTEDGE